MCGLCTRCIENLETDGYDFAVRGEFLVKPLATWKRTDLVQSSSVCSEFFVKEWPIQKCSSYGKIFVSPTNGHKR